MMRRVTEGFGLLALGLALAVPASVQGSEAVPAAGATRLRVAIPVIRDREAIDGVASGDELQEFRRIAGIMLRERQRDCSSFDLVSQPRCDAIMQELTSKVRTFRADRLLGEFRQFQDIDTLVYYRWSSANRVEVWLMSDSGVVQTNWTVSYFPPPFIPHAQKTVEFIARNLRISPGDRQVMTNVLVADRERLLNICRSLYYPEPAIVGDVAIAQFGELRLNLLAPSWAMDNADEFFAVAVVKAAYEMFLSPHRPPPKMIIVIRDSFTKVLGTRDEAAAFSLAALAPSVFVQDAIEAAKPLMAVDYALEKALGEEAREGKADGMSLSDTEPESSPVKTPVPRSRRLGALRLLGLFNQPGSTALLKRALVNEEPDVREAAAFGAGALPAAAAVELLRPMLKDRNPRVVFAAAAELRKHGAPSPDLVEMAKRFAADKSRLGREAVAVLGEIGGRDAVPLLRKLAAERAEPRLPVIAGLLRLDAVDDRQRLEWLSDCDEAVIMAVLSSSPDLAAGAVLRPRLEALANDPFRPLANRALYLLSRHRPADPRQRLDLELLTGHPYLREQLLDALADDGGEAALTTIRAACDNPDPHVRSKALDILVRRDPAMARPYVTKALDDPHLWVRFHAAALAPKVADAGMIPALKKAFEHADHSSTRLYLGEALAKVGGGTAPKEPEPARSIAGKRNLAWCTTPALYAADSPFDAYYCMDTGNANFNGIKGMHLAHDAGKILFGRASPIRAPARLILDPSARDEFIPRLDSELTDEVMQLLDGIVYGEETMDALTDQLWDDGWQLFCRDAKIDPVKIDGKIEKLNPYERHAWNDWAGRINTRGFNKLYDFTKLRYGRLRPGLQVGSFIFNGPGVKCDFAGIYDYRGDNRLCAYDLVRHFKTLFPDRPVLWLSLGVGGYNMNPVFNTQTVPAGPLFDIYDRCWSDSLTAWLAGAETGWFSVWFFMKPGKGTALDGLAGLRGKTVWVEDIAYDSPVLEEAIDYSQEHMLVYKEPVVAPKAPGSGALEGRDDADDQLSLEDPDEKIKAGQAALDASLARRKEEMRAGFLHYQQYVYDCARILASLPRQVYRTQVLVNRGDVDVWTRPPAYPLVPAHALLNRYDYLLGFNQAPLLDLSRYRLFITHNPGYLTDETIAAVTRWLRENPGLLIVHGDLTADNAAEVGSVEHHDGKLQLDWPWENDVRVVTDVAAINRETAPLELALGRRKVKLKTGSIGSYFEITGPRASAVAGISGRAVLALWRAPAFKGAVLFDGMQFVSNDYLEALRETINRLFLEFQVGVPVEGPVLLETLDTPSFKAVASSRYHWNIKEPVIVPGLEALSGGFNTLLGRLFGSTSALALRNYVGRFVAASESLIAVSDKPFSEARIDGDDLVLKSPGVVRIAGVGGAARIATLDGGELPVRKPAEVKKGESGPGDGGFAEWRFKSGEEGIFDMQGRRYFRSRVTVRARVERAPPSTKARDAGVTPELQAIRKAQAEKDKARKRRPAEELALDLGGGVRMAFVKIAELDAWVGKYEVANEEYRRFKPAHYSGEGFNGDRQPVVNVSCDDAEAFAAWVNRELANNLPQGFRARLPDSREWMIFAQCGDGRTYPWGDLWAPEYGNYFDKTNAPCLVGSYRDGYVDSTCPVEQSGCNDWRLYGVGGNIWEWTSEQAKEEGGWRVRRGASWTWEIAEKGGYEEYLRCGYRSRAFSSLRDHGTGFRLVLAAHEKQ